jgi:hypothetical protein
LRRESPLTQRLQQQPQLPRSEGSDPRCPNCGAELRRYQKSDSECRLGNPRRHQCRLRHGPATKIDRSTTIRADKRRNLRLIPCFGRGGPDVKAFMRMSFLQLKKTREKLLPLQRQLRKSIVLANACASLMIGTIIEVTHIDADLTSYLAVHQDGFAVICKKPPLRLMNRLMEILLHCRSTLLTPFGLVRFLNALNGEFSPHGQMSSDKTCFQAVAPSGWRLLLDNREIGRLCHLASLYT